MTCKFSVLMSLYHRERADFLYECLESLNIQTLRPDDVVIVYDGEVGNDLHSVVLDFMAKLPIRIIKLDSNVGLGNALNVGILHCKHELIARMDTDDICVYNRFEKQIPFMINNPKISICGSFIQEIDPETDEKISLRTVPVMHEDIVKSYLYKSPFNHMTVVYRKSDILAVGSYMHLHLMEDWYLWIRMIAAGKLGENLSEPLVNARAGYNMLSRRRGLKYAESEYKIMLIKNELLLSNRFMNFFVFFLRAVLRFMPVVLLGLVYKILRKKL
ncbi:glycosyltransferase [Thorsellia kenyensis]|uniref:Glycosyltransferase n=1 Tax=Thorsellia kenyensis TaxID=1549888 RepID=A0ABV6CAH2_9GAMM